MSFEPPPLYVERQESISLDDPVYLPPKAPYRYKLRLKNYQEQVPNHCRARLLVATASVEVVSTPVHLFTW
jgi:hypothetical protein